MLEDKLDRLINLLENHDLYKHTTTSNSSIIKETIINSVLASALGYFLFRVLDFHFRHGQPKRKRRSR